MKSLAGELKRDPQLESLMRNRQRELGIAPGSGLDRMMREQNIERAIDHSIERDRGLGMLMTPGIEPRSRAPTRSRFTSPSRQ